MSLTSQNNKICETIFFKYINSIWLLILVLTHLLYICILATTHEHIHANVPTDASVHKHTIVLSNIYKMLVSLLFASNQRNRVDTVGLNIGLLCSYLTQMYHRCTYAHLLLSLYKPPLYLQHHHGNFFNPASVSIS